MPDSRTEPPAQAAPQDEAPPAPDVLCRIQSSGSALLPEAAACFPADDGVDCETLTEQLRENLAQLRARGEADPYGNPIQTQSLHIARRLQSGELGYSAIEQLIQRLTAEAFMRRAERLRAYLGEVDPDTNAATIASLIGRIARPDPDGDPVPFDDFRTQVERALYGFVITAHPTFSLAVELQRELVEFAVGIDREGRALDTGARAAIVARAARAEHRPERRLDLDAEHEQALAAIDNIHLALRRACRIVLDIGRETFPDRWTDLAPCLATVATWVGYDLDGRSDIPWTMTFAKRLRVQKLQLAYYRDVVRRLRSGLDRAAPVGRTLDLIDARLALSIKEVGDDLEGFAAASAGPDWRERLGEISRRMAGTRDGRLVSCSEIVDLLGSAAAQTDDEGLQTDLCLLRAELLNHGFALAQTHVRINAVQLHNAIRKAIPMETAPDDPSRRRSYLAAIAELIDGARPVTIHFGSIDAEKTTARRVFMIMVQMLKYLDAQEPIRFLIAECETPFTLLTALYFARLFGIEDRIDISPLFETRTALGRGARIVDEALGFECYRSYVRRRGRLCIQTGFSDAGRYLGQPAAAVMIERIRLRLAEIMADRGLADVELVVFDTHGESIGRGAHPDSLRDRLDYLETPESRARAQELGLRVKEETSFQGGDGYLLFMTGPSALAVLTRVLEHALAPAGERGDVFYAEADYVDEFFTATAQFHARLMDDPCFAALLGAWGTNMLYRTGSRAVKRQYDTRSGQMSLEHPSQLRAIPHNAILQQLGHLANTIGGLGAAVGRDPERFQRFYRESPRFRLLMSMVEHAFKWSDLNVLKAYIDLLDPGLWLLRASRGRDGQEIDDMRRVAETMEMVGVHDRLLRVWRTFQRDYLDLAAALREHRRLTRSAGEEPIAVDIETRDNIHQLHAVRLALIQQLYLLTVHVPEFSNRHDLTHESIIGRLVHLDVEDSLDLLGKVFPATDPDEREIDYGEEATYEGGENQSYALEHARIFRPIGRHYELIRRISTGVIHHIGAVG